MRVLIVNTSERTGGAAVAANRLMKALNNHGVKAKMLVMHKESDSLTVAALPKSPLLHWHFLWERLVIWVNNLFSRKNLFKVSIANTGTDITTTKEFKEADIIHLQWINQGFLGLSDIKRILRSGKAIVWTMHDMWEMTAICHHAYTCTRYETKCQDCPFLALSGKNDLAAHTFNKKQRLLAGQKITFVAVSNWLKTRAENSTLLGNFPITVIPNSISLSHFSKMNRAIARASMEVKEHYVVCFGAARIDDDIKGIKYLIEALHIIYNQRQIESGELRLLLFGSVKDESVLDLIPVNYSYLGTIQDESTLSRIYAASNAVVSSSLYETFGQTLIEAQACGCVPVAFDNSGQTDIIKHKVNGYLATYLSAESLAEGILWAVKSGIPYEILRDNVLHNYAEDVVAKQYIRLYESALGKKTGVYHD